MGGNPGDLPTVLLSTLQKAAPVNGGPEWSVYLPLVEAGLFLGVRLAEWRHNVRLIGTTWRCEEWRAGGVAALVGRRWHEAAPSDGEDTWSLYRLLLPLSEP